VKPNTRYRASFYAKAGEGFAGPVRVALVSNDGATVHASAQVPRVTGSWKKYEVILTTRAAKPSAENRLIISTGGAGTVWFSMVSLFPPTFNNRPNGNRKDIMQLLAGMKPAFLRFPGGNYVEGRTIATRFDWKKTIGDISQRPGHMNDAWRYWSSDGMGLLEFLEWCEDLHMDPVLAVYAGYSLAGERVAAGKDLEPFVKDALDEIEYTMGAAGTTWGARRAKDGLRRPSSSSTSRWATRTSSTARREVTRAGCTILRCHQAKYPKLNVVTTARVSGRNTDVLDEHYYRRSEMRWHRTRTITTRASAPDSEFSWRVGHPRGRADAQHERRSGRRGLDDGHGTKLGSGHHGVLCSAVCERETRAGMQWPTDLIGFDAMGSYGSPAYYAQQMFSVHHGDVVLPATAQGVPTREWQPPAAGGRRGAPGTPTPPPQPPPPPQQVPTLFFDATRDSKAGTIYLKVVNRAGTPQPVRVEISGTGGRRLQGPSHHAECQQPG